MYINSNTHSLKHFDSIKPSSHLKQDQATGDLESKVKNGHIKRITDGDINSSVIEIVGANVNTCFITAPADPSKTLGIKLAFLVMVIKNVVHSSKFLVSFHL